MKNGRPRHTLNQGPSSFRFSPVHCALALAPIAFCLFTSVAVPAGAPQTAGESPQTREPAQQLLRDVVWNEVHAQDTDHSYWRFRKLQQENGKTELLEVFETTTGQIHRLLAVDGAPLTGAQRDAENRRIQQALDHPDQIEKAQKKRNQDGDEELRLLKMLPNAFNFRYDGSQDGAVKLAFTPNPNFHPDNREAEVFHHMEGTIMVDARWKRLVEINGVLTSDVKFGAGVLGHLYKGGTFCVRQRDVGQGHWDTTLVDVRMDGRALFFKTIAVRQKESYSNYERLPNNISLQQAARQLSRDTTS